MGLSRFRKRYAFDIVSIESLENIQCRYIFETPIIELMESPETWHLWWGDTFEDVEDAERYAEMLRQLQREAMEL